MNKTGDPCFCDGGASKGEINVPILMKATLDPYFCGVKMNEVPPPRWIMWGHLSPKGASPAPTIIHVGMDILNMLARDDFNRVGFILQRYGYQCVALDSPCYGFDLKPGEKDGLPGWRQRIEKGEPFIEDFASKVSHLLDHLIKDTPIPTGSSFAELAGVDSSPCTALPGNRASSACWHSLP